MTAFKSTANPYCPEEVSQEANLLSCWFDTEGAARRIHVLLVMLEEHVAELENVPDGIFVLLLAAKEHAAQLGDAIFAVDALEYHLKKHDLAIARAEQAEAKGSSKRRPKRQEVADEQP